VEIPDSKSVVGFLSFNIHLIGAAKVQL